MSAPSLQSALAAAIQTLRAADNPDAATDARRLLAAALGVAPDRLTTQGDRLLTATESVTFAAHIAARLTHQPVSKIIGRRAFWKHEFIVTPDVLDPRPDTETLVAAALDAPFVKLLDLGTGSGCILLSLLAERPMAHGTGTDISPAALAVAQRNATALNLTARARLIQSDWFAGVEGRYDLILSNPPYIAAAEMPGLDPEVRDHDPHIALTPGGDGLGAYRIIAAGAPARLISGGRILLEIGSTQGPAVTAILHKAGFADIRILPDFDRRDRVVSAQKP